MNLLIVGSGGREHAMAWKMAQSPKLNKLFIAPGNAGTELESKTENVAISADDLEGLKLFALDNNIELTIVGPEATLCLGIVDLFSDAGLKCFGPSKGAAQLEGSKGKYLSLHCKHLKALQQVILGSCLCRYW